MHATILELSIAALAPPNGYVASEGVAINNNGQIAATLYTSAFGTNPFSSALYTNGTFTSIQGTAQKQFSLGINSAGTIVGSFFPGVAAFSGFSVTAAGTETGLKNLNTGVTSHGSEAFGVNNTGIVVGSSYTSANTVAQAVVWVGGTSGNPTAPTATTTPTNIGSFAAGTASTAYAINSPGTASAYEVVGTADGYAFMYTKAGGMTHVPGLTTTLSDAYAINNNGAVTGDEDYDVNGDYEAYLYDPSLGTTTLLGLLGDLDSEGNAINLEEEVVGNAYNGLDADGNFIDSTAFLYADGTMIDLNSLLPVNSGWVLQDAEGINDSGQIVGYGTFNGVEEGFLLNTQDAPEPGSLVLLAGGMATLLISRRFLLYR